MTTGAKGIPRGAGRVVSDDDLPAFAERIHRLKGEGLSLSQISERIGSPVSTIVHRLARLRKIQDAKSEET